ncbi:MAG: hypothetical protein ACLQFR_17220 [Streptosporangiaceae bacterium]
MIEQVFADWTSGPLAHLPSGRFAANAARLTLAAITHNLLRSAGCLASPIHGKARGATIRADLIDVAARMARSGRGRLTPAPAAGLASPDGMAEPVPGRLRAARPGGLTSPKPGRAQSTAPDPRHPDPAPGTRTSRTRSERQQNHASQKHQITSHTEIYPETITRIHAVDRGLS